MLIWGYIALAILFVMTCADYSEDRNKPICRYPTLGASCMFAIVSLCWPIIAFLFVARFMRKI